MESNKTAEYIITSTLINKLPKSLTDGMVRTVGDKVLSLSGFRVALNQELNVMFGGEQSVRPK